jgi:hypothetical protein
MYYSIIPRSHSRSSRAQFPTQDFLNGSMAVNTTGILTQVSCAIPNAFSVNSSVATNWKVSATSADGCTVNTNFNPSDSNQQFGVENVPNCGSNSTDPTFQPVRFPLPPSQPLLIPFRFSFGFGERNQTRAPQCSAKQVSNFMT